MKCPSSSGISALLIPITLCGAQSLLYASSENPSSSNPNLACEINPATVGENGYQLEVYLTNTGAGTINGWTVTLDFSESPLITGSWNADIAETSPDTISGSNVAWNGKLLPGQTTSFGLQGNHDGSFVLPGCTAR
jgi:endoglucanase